MSLLKLIPGYPSFNGTVRTVVFYGNLAIVGGDFTSVNGQARGHLCAVNMLTKELMAWDGRVATTDGGEVCSVNCLLVKGNYLYIGGTFTDVGDDSFYNAIAFDLSTADFNFTDGLSHADWDPQPEKYSIESINIGVVTAICYEPNSDQILIGGNFDSMVSTPRANIGAFCRANVFTGLATWDPGADGIVRAITVAATTVYVAGGFNTFAGSPRNYLGSAEYNSNAANAWDPSPDSDVYSMMQSNGLLYVSGSFLNIAGESRGTAAAFDLAGPTISSWNPQADLFTFGLGSLGTSIYMAGGFDQAGGKLRKDFCEVSSDTGLATTFTPDPDQQVLSLATGNFYLAIGGDFAGTSEGPAERFAVYSIQPNPSIPKPPTISFLNRSITDLGNLTILRWRPPTYDVDNQPVEVTGYKIYRTTSSNLETFTQIAEITTISASGLVDTIFTEISDDHVAYGVTAVNSAGESEMVTAATVAQQQAEQFS